MADDVSRRDWVKMVGAAAAGSALPSTSPVGTADSSALSAVPSAEPASPEILPVTSTTDVFVPPKGRGYNKFSFSSPEPAIAYQGLRFSFLVFTRENAYAMDPSLMSAAERPDGMEVTCTGFTWAGGQEKARGRLTARLRNANDGVEWDVTAEMDQPIKTVTTVLRDVPRGSLSVAGGDFYDPHDNEVLLGYPFSGGDLFGGNSAGGLTTALVVVKGAGESYVALSSRDTSVRTKRIYLQPGEKSYRVELIHEGEGWLDQNVMRVPTWRVTRTSSPEAAVAPHYEHLRVAYRLPDFAQRPDVPDWLRETALVLTLHGQHYTGYVFNDYVRMLEILRWVNTQIPGRRVLAFISSWDGRYYWDYPNYEVNDRMGGERAFRALVKEGQQMGFRFMPMFGMNSANTKQPGFARIADAVTHKVDGDEVDLNWVDWDNDRHQEGWLAYMNLGVASWRAHLAGRIDDMITRYGVDAYFLDIAGGHINDTRADMHAGVKRLVTDLRVKHPNVLCCGEMHYDAMLEFIPLYHSGGGGRYARPHIQRHAHFFSHLSLPAPGRGSTGVHEAGFGRFDPETLNLNPNAIPTLNVVDDTFSAHRATMAAVIERAKERAGIV